MIYRWKGFKHLNWIKATRSKSLLSLILKNQTFVAGYISQEFFSFVTDDDSIIRLQGAQK